MPQKTTDDSDAGSASQTQPVRGERLHNVAASVNHRLLMLAKERHDEFQLVLTRYALERLLSRLGQSPYRSEFVVKGALLFSVWSDTPHRVTRDLDLLGFGTADVVRLEQVFRDLCQVPVEDDGLRFVEETIHAEPIRIEQAHGGIRVRLLALLGKARIPLQIDVGFGDVVTPAPSLVTYPTLLSATYLPPSTCAYLSPRDNGRREV